MLLEFKSSHQIITKAGYRMVLEYKTESKPFDNRVGLAGHGAEQFDGSLFPHSVSSQTDQEVWCFGKLNRIILPQRHHSLHLLKYRKSLLFDLHCMDKIHNTVKNIFFCAPQMKKSHQVWNNNTRVSKR